MQIAKDKAKAGNMVTRNIVMTTTVILGFVFAQYRKGECEEKLANRYLWMLNDQEVRNFDSLQPMLVRKI